MKKIFTLLFALTLSGLGFAQSIVDFETVGQDWAWTVFANVDDAPSLYSVVVNPDKAGINTSDNVAKYIVNSAANPWAGIWTADIADFTFDESNSLVKIMVYKDVISNFAIKFEGDAGNVELKVPNTKINEWEELEFNFSTKIGVTYKVITIMPDFSDPRTAGSTNYFDNISFNALTEPPVELPSLPIDFESGTFSFIDFDGGVATVIANPQSSGINTSATVAQIVRDGGQTWGGSKLLLNSKIDFSEGSAFSMKVYSTRAGVPVLFKLEGDAGAQAEVSVNTTVANEWETLEWDFTGKPSNTYNSLVFMFDFGNVGDGTANSTFLFDDIELIDNTGGLSQIDLPVDFESTTVNYALTDFGGNASSLVEDPENSANMVAKVIKTAGAQTWAGTTIGTALGFVTNIPISLTDSKMAVRVWSPDANTPIRLKIEDANDETHTCETQTNTTVTAAWETIVFDFANQATGTESLSVGLGYGWVYNKASIFFNFGSDGTGLEYYFDDVEMYSETMGFDELNKIDFQVYPNPATDYLFISNSSDLKRIEIYTVTGQKLRSLEFISNKIQIAELPKGVYLLSAETNSGEIFTTKFFKH